MFRWICSTRATEFSEKEEIIHSLRDQYNRETFYLLIVRGFMRNSLSAKHCYNTNLRLKIVNKILFSCFK